MEFRPKPGDALTIGSDRYEVAASPVLPRSAYAQGGRKAIVYKLIRISNGRREPCALKVFAKKFRGEYIVRNADRLGQIARLRLPGMAACERQILSPGEHGVLLAEHPDLAYSVLMPWLGDQTWGSLLKPRKPLHIEQSLKLAQRVATVLSRLEEETLAHCDVARLNVMIDLENLTINLIDLEDMYGPGLPEPKEILKGTDGYRHRESEEHGQWCPEGDRFASAVLLTEILAWHVPVISELAYGMPSFALYYFDPTEMHDTDCARYPLMVDALSRVSAEIVGLFEQAWMSETLAGCPRLERWAEAIDGAVEVHLAPPPVPEPAAADEQTPVVVQEPQEIERAAEVQALVASGKNALATGDLAGAILLFEQALELDGDAEKARQLLDEAKDRQAEVQRIRRELEETIESDRDKQIVQFWQEHAAWLEDLPEAQVHRARVEEARARCEALDQLQDALASGKIGLITRVLTAQRRSLDACQDLAAGDRERAEGAAVLYRTLRQALEVENDLEVRRLNGEIQREWPGGLEAEEQQQVGKALGRLESKARELAADGQAALARGDAASGIAFLEQALNLDGDNEQARQLLNDARAMQAGVQTSDQEREWAPDEAVEVAEPPAGPTQVRALVDRARSTFEQGDLYRAEALLGEALELDPGNEEIRQFRDRVRQQNPRLRYYDPSVKGWLPQSQPYVRIDVPYKLVIVEGFREGVWYPIFPNSKLTMGRSSRCNIVLNDDHVSRQHAILTFDGARCQIEDRGSLNGTYLNGKRITGRREVRAGDYLQFGDILMRLEAGRPVPSRQ